MKRIDRRNNGITAEVKGELRLGQVHCNGPEGDYVIIDIEDEASGISFLSVKIAHEQVANLFMHKATKCEVELNGLALLGCTREVKREFVPGSPGYSTRDADTAKAFEPFEVDGWSGLKFDYCNHHRSTKKDGVAGHSVSFVRFVRPDGTPVI